MKSKYIIIIVCIAVLAALLSSCSWKSKQSAQSNKANNLTSQKATSENDQSQSQSNASDKQSAKELLLQGMMDILMEDFEAVDLNGNSVKLSDYKGKIIFLNFWATWCPPCQEEMPYMQEVYNEYKDQDVVILAVNSTTVELRGGDDSAEAEKRAKAFIKDKGYTFPVLLDKNNDAWAIYQQRGIPANYVIDKQGIVRYAFAGAFPSKEQMIQYIENIRAIEP